MPYRVNYGRVGSELEILETALEDDFLLILPSEDPNNIKRIRISSIAGLVGVDTTTPIVELIFEGVNGASGGANTGRGEGIAVTYGANVVLSNVVARPGRVTSLRINNANAGTPPIKITPLIVGSEYTFEFWVYPLDGNASQQLFGMRSDGGAFLNGGLSVSPFSNTLSHWHASGTVTAVGPNLTANTWSHVSVTRTNGGARFFVNGVRRSTFTSAQLYGAFNELWIGANAFSSNSNANIYLSDFRYYDYAKYLANFTPE